MILAGNEDIRKSLDEFDFGQDLKTITELAALERLKINVPPFLRCY